MIGLMKFTMLTCKRYRTIVPIFILFLQLFGLWQHAVGAEVFQINGYYLGATPEEIGVTVDSDLALEEKFYEAETNGVRLFFVRVQDRLRVYRIVKEETTKPNNIKSILSRLKSKYGTPDKQLIKTSSVRPKYKKDYSTSIKNKAIWNITDSQEFIAEIESERVVYELIDHNPEKFTLIQRPEATGEGGFTVEGWDPDY